MTRVRRLVFCPNSPTDSQRTTRTFWWHRGHGGQLSRQGRASRGTVKRRERWVCQPAGRQRRVWAPLRQHPHSFAKKSPPAGDTTIKTINIINGDGWHRLVSCSCLIAPGLGRNLFLVKQATRNGIESILDTDNPTLEANDFTVPLQELGRELCCFSLDLTDRRGTPELSMQAAVNATLWHRRLGYLIRKSLDLSKKPYNSGMSFDTVPEYYICAVGRVTSWSPPRQPFDYRVKHPSSWSSQA